MGGGIQLVVIQSGLGILIWDYGQRGKQGLVIGGVTGVFWPCHHQLKPHTAQSI